MAPRTERSASDLLAPPDERTPPLKRLRSSLTVALTIALAALTLWVVVPAAAAVPGAAIRITEFAYGGKVAGAGGTDGEYVELTNVGDAPQDLTGWTYDNSAATAATGLSLTGLGTVAPGESVIVTDLTAAEFGPTGAWSPG